MVERTPNMPERIRRRTRAIELHRQGLRDASTELRSLAEEISALPLEEKRRLSEELLGLSEGLRAAGEERLRALSEELKLGADPAPAPRDLRLAGEDLALVARAVSQVSEGIHGASAELAWASLAKGREALEAGRAYAMGVEVGETGYHISTLARAILSMADDQRRFLQVLLRHPARPKRKAPSGAQGVLPRAKGPREEVWGALESEDLVRKKPRRDPAKGSERPPKRLVRFPNER